MVIQRLGVHFLIWCEEFSWVSDTFTTDLSTVYYICQTLKQTKHFQSNDVSIEPSFLHVSKETLCTNIGETRKGLKYTNQTYYGCFFAFLWCKQSIIDHACTSERLVKYSQLHCLQFCKTWTFPLMSNMPFNSHEILITFGQYARLSRVLLTVQIWPIFSFSTWGVRSSYRRKSVIWKSYPDSSIPLYKDNFNVFTDALKFHSKHWL